MVGTASDTNESLSWSLPSCPGETRHLATCSTCPAVFAQLSQTKCVTGEKREGSTIFSCLSFFWAGAVRGLLFSFSASNRHVQYNIYSTDIYSNTVMTQTGTHVINFGCLCYSINNVKLLNIVFPRTTYFAKRRKKKNTYLLFILITIAGVTFVATGYYDTDPKKKEKGR